ncbi:Xanthine-guanine phosphoribosyltransferase [Buchnera aphidicola (Phyllaphis fagi)]|uniref:xanthine phosphoribosyltransferase n=1 Tax=Buchnera aphidicola TaxID=9 RepID=UPI003464E10F
MNEKYIVTWDILQIYTRTLAKKIMSIKKWKSIIAVSRGGLIPAALLARELSIRIVDTICIASYNYNNFKKIQILKKPSQDYEDVLIVDDLSDSGRTAKIIRKMYPKAHFVTIFAKPRGRKLVDQYLINVPQNVWIEQPWDMSVVYISPLIKESKIK